MKSIDRPNLEARLVYMGCAVGIANPSERSRLVFEWENINLRYAQYEYYGNSNSLSQITPVSVDASALLNQEYDGYRRLYSGQMSVQGRPGRDFYDAMLMAYSPNKCPYCGVGRAKTLDHFLPKSKFPWFSVFPPNLVPCCMDCNNLKGSKVTHADREMINPYYIEGRFEGRWLYAQVEESSPPALKYQVDPPLHWDLKERKSIERHFQDFDLRTKFAAEAAEEISILAHTYRNYRVDDLREELQVRLDGHRSRNMNSWQTAMYEALANSAWYWNVGFAQ